MGMSEVANCQVCEDRVGGDRGFSGLGDEWVVANNVLSPAAIVFRDLEFEGDVRVGDGDIAAPKVGQV